MNIRFNGTETEIAEGMTLAEFLAEKKISRENVILELNEEVVGRKDDLSAFLLKDGDVLNLYAVVAGG